MKATVAEVYEDGSARMEIEGMSQEELELFASKGLVYILMQSALDIHDDDEFFEATLRGKDK